LHFSPPSAFLNLQENEEKPNFKMNARSLSPAFRKLETPLFRENNLKMKKGLRKTRNEVIDKEQIESIYQ
jgi:hypothetical protein